MDKGRRRDNVVRGQFGRSGRGAGRRDWQKPSAYGFEPDSHRRGQRSAGAEHRFLRPNWIWAGIIGVVAAVGIGKQFGGDSALGAEPAGGGGEVVAASVAISASFGSCKDGGGTNCVVDGDTIYLHGQKIRMADIDAPETHDYKCPSELERGEAAAQRLRALVNSGPLTLEAIDRDEDRYGRKLRIVKVGGTSVGETLVNEGLARWYEGGRKPWC